MGDGRFMGEGSAGLILLSLAGEQERESEGEREGGKEGERGREEMCPICGRKTIAVHTHTHTSLVSSWDYCSALRSNGAKAGMNR